MSKFCENCGSELRDTDKACPNCGAAVVETTTKKDVEKNTNQATNTTSSNNGVPTDSNKKKFAIIGGIAGGVVLLLIIVLAIVSAANAYKKPLDNFCKGMQTANVNTFLKAFPDVMKDDLKDEFDKDDMKELKEDMEDALGKNLKISYKISKKEKIDKDDLEDIQDALEDEYDAKKSKTKVTAGYKLTVKYTFKGKDDSKTTGKMTVPVYKVGGKWCIISPATSLTSLF